MNVHGIEITNTEITDIEIVGALIPAKIVMCLKKVVTDGGYYSQEIIERNIRKKNEKKLHLFIFNSIF